MKTGETRCLTRSAMSGIVGDVSDITELIVSDLQCQVTSFLSSSGCSADVILPYFSSRSINNPSLILIAFIGLAAFYAWARAKHFGCHSVCHSVCHNGTWNIACSTAATLSPLMGKVSLSYFCIQRSTQGIESQES